MEKELCHWNPGRVPSQALDLPSSAGPQSAVAVSTIFDPQITIAAAAATALCVPPTFQMSQPPLKTLLPQQGSRVPGQCHDWTWATRALAHC